MVHNVAPKADKKGKKDKAKELKPPRRKFLSVVRMEYPMYLFALPAVIVTIIFAYLPMFMNIIAFMDYKITNPGWLGLGSEWVWFDNFKSILTDPVFYQISARTIFYSCISVFARLPVPFILALLMNELRNVTFKRVVQTFSYLPHFVSWVTIGSLVYLFSSTDITTGLFNSLRAMVGLKPVLFMRSLKLFPIFLFFSEVFKNAGYNTIIYLAAIGSLDPQLYEAATIDGANRFQQLRFITIPGILPTVMILLIMSVGSLFSSNFDQIVNMQNPTIVADTNTLPVYVYSSGIRSGKYSRATAIGLFQGVINCGLLLGTNFVSNKITGSGLF